MHAPLDAFDPNTWTLRSPHEYRLYGDDRATMWAVVDEIDYHWAVQWRWAPKVSKGGKKVYLYRTGSINNCKVSIYLHVAIMERTGILKPSRHHIIADHRNGDGLDCRRHNLRWATPKMNRANLFGMYPHDLIEG